MTPAKAFTKINGQRETREAELRALVTELAAVDNTLPPPALAAKRFRATVTDLLSNFEKQIPRIVNGGDFARLAGNAFADFDDIVALIFWASPTLVDSLEKHFIANYPSDFITDEDRAKKIAKLKSEIREANKRLCGLYEEFSEAGLAFTVAPEVDPAIFLGLDQ